jgi:hypothetical protein
MPGANCGSPQFGADGLVFFTSSRKTALAL